MIVNNRHYYSWCDETIAYWMASTGPYTRDPRLRSYFGKSFVFWQHLRKADIKQPTHRVTYSIAGIIRKSPNDALWEWPISANQYTKTEKHWPYFWCCIMLGLHKPWLLGQGWKFHHSAMYHSEGWILLFLQVVTDNSASSFLHCWFRPLPNDWEGNSRLSWTTICYQWE